MAYKLIIINGFIIGSPGTLFDSSIMRRWEKLKGIIIVMHYYHTFGIEP